MLKWISAILLVGVLGFGYGRYSAPVKTETKEVVTKETEYITREIKRPDGTIVKEVIKKDSSQLSNESKADYKKSEYKIGIIAKYDFETNKQNYGGTIEKRVFGNVFAGVYADTNKNVGLAVSMEF